MIKELVDLFKAYCKVFGVNETIQSEICFVLFSLGFSVTFFAKIWDFIKYLALRRNQKILNHDLHHYYSITDVYNRTKYYINPKFQNVAPSEDEEPGRKYIASAKNNLIPLFLKKVFPFGKTDNKHFIVLADSGMGKTAFLINLYISYKNRFQVPFSLPKFNIKIFPIGHPDTFNDIEQITDPYNTILLLDAFDEDIEAEKDYTRRMNYILKKTSRFRCIVITVRTQFFPSQKEEPYETGYFTGGDKGEYKFQKIYLSVFDERDVKNYLRRRFKSLLRIKYWYARKIVSKCPNLVVRPMLLSHIDDLIGSKREFDFSFQVYEEMVKFWAIRESGKRGIKEKFKTELNFQQLLYLFSEKLAINLYENRGVRNGLYITKDDDFSVGELGLEEIDNQYKFSTQEIKSKSLLNRNAAGNYKFSHKSILEYFLARHCFREMNFYLDFDFKGMDSAKRFFEEMVIYQVRSLNNGEFAYTLTSTSRDKKHSLEDLSYNKLQSIEYLKLSLTKIFPSHFLKVFPNLKRLIIIDINLFKDIQSLYSKVYKYNAWLEFIDLINLIDYDKRIEKDYPAELIELLKLKRIIELREYGERLLKSDLRELKKIVDGVNLEDRIKKTDVQDFIQSHELLKLLEMMERLERIEWMERIELRESDFEIEVIENWLLLELASKPKYKLIQSMVPKNVELGHLKEWIGRIRNKGYSTISDVIGIRDSIKMVKEIETLLPNCKIYY